LSRVDLPTWQEEILGFQLLAETVENQTKETIGDAGGEENGPELSGRIG